MFSQNLKILALSVEDSVFCRTKFPYDFDRNDYIYGFGVPDKLIDGKEMSLVKIIMQVQNKVKANFDKKNIKTDVSLSVVVDNKGNIRGVIFNSNSESAIEIVKYTYGLITNYHFTPASNRGFPVTSHFTFVIKIP